MKNTRFMELMFSTQDEELKKQVENDINSAANGEAVDTDEVKYEKTDNGDVAITDKETGEVTIAQKSVDEPNTYDLIAVPDEQLERFVHPSEDGKKGQAMGAPDEHVETHIPAGSISGATGEVTEVEDTAKAGPAAVCPECGKEECECGNTKQFSVTSDNVAWQRVFSMPQEFVDYLFSEVIESEETSKVGDLKVEKLADEDNAVVVTSESTGDQVKVKLEGDQMEVTELDSRNFSNYLPLFVIGVQPYDHILVEAQEYDRESAEQLVAQLTEDGVEGCQIFETPEDARDYAISLLEGLGANPAAGDVDEVEEQKEYSEHYGCLGFYTTNYRTDDSVLMSRMFSEQAEGITETRDAVEVAISEGDETQLGDAVVVPIDAQNALIQDGEEFTLATLSGEDMVLEKIDADEAQDILGDESIIESESEENDDPFGAEEDEEEKEYSIYSDEAETRFFSENEEMTDYMERIFSDESDQNFIEEAIAEGQEIENESEIITPIDSETAIVEDKESGEFTKATIMDEDRLNLHPISEDEAENLLGDIVVDTENEEEVKEFSDYEVYTNEAETRFFSEVEEMTDYMERIFSEESDQERIEEAIAEGKQIENATEVITPVDATTAIVEDKENGEFTKAEINDEDTLDLNPISEEEADELTKDLKVDEENEEKELEEGEEAPEEKADAEKEFSNPLDRFFAEAVVPAAAPAAAPVAVAAPTAAPAAVAPAEGEAAPVVVEEQASVEQIEDKALAAVQSIKAAAEEAAAQIMEAKAAPVPNAEPEIQEAQFSYEEEEGAEEKTFSQDAQNDTLISWLAYK